MKKVLFLIAILFIAQLSFSQESTFKQDVLKMISLGSSDTQMKMAKSQFLKTIPEADQAAFSKSFDATLPGFYDKMVKIYMEVYTHDDLKAIIEFYESPIGKKMSKNSGLIAEKSIQAGQEWAKELQQISANYANASLVENNSDNTIYNTAGIEVKPEFPGGMNEFYKFIATNYVSPQEKGLAGKVYVTFVVEKDGSLSDIKVLRDIGYGTGKEAIRVLKLSPKWMSGEQNGKKVRCTYSLPIAIMAK